MPFISWFLGFPAVVAGQNQHCRVAEISIPAPCCWRHRSCRTRPIAIRPAAAPGKSSLSLVRCSLALRNTLPFTAQAPVSTTVMVCTFLSTSTVITAFRSYPEQKEQCNFNPVDGQFTIFFLQTELLWVCVWCEIFHSGLIDGPFKCVTWSRYDSTFFKAIRQLCWLLTVGWEDKCRWDKNASARLIWKR